MSENAFYSKIMDDHFESRHPGEIPNSKYLADLATYRWLGNSPCPLIFDKNSQQQETVDEDVWKLLFYHFGGLAIPKNPSSKPNFVKLRILPKNQ